MVRMFVRRKVQDYAAWCKGYDAFESTRARLGAQGRAVHREVDDGNDVTVWHDFDNFAAAQAFARICRRSRPVARTPRFIFRTRRRNPLNSRRGVR